MAPYVVDSALHVTCLFVGQMLNEHQVALLLLLGC
jgi:hypothetical protein